MRPQVKLRAGPFVAMIVGLLFPLSSSAIAQERYYPGTFEGALSGSERQLLGATLAVAAGYDDTPAPDKIAPVLGQEFQPPGFFSTIAPRGVYQSRGMRLNVALEGGTNGRYYGEINRLVAVNHYANANVSMQVTPSTSLFVGQSASYSPAYLNRLFSTLGPGLELEDPIQRASDDALSRVHSYAYSTTINLNHKLTRKATLTFSAGGRYTHFVDDIPQIADLRGVEGGGRYTYAWDRNITLQGGYEYRVAKYSATQQSTEHVIDIGVAYRHRWSKTRRTLFQVTAGPRAVTQAGTFTPVGTITPPTTEAGTELPPAQVKFEPQYGVVGNALVDHQIGRTWTVRASGGRDVSYIEGLPNPVFSNSYNITVLGYLNPRVDLSATVGHATGDSSVFPGITSPFTDYTGTLQVRMAVSKRWAFYGEYVYDDYEFRNVTIPIGIAPVFNRSGVRVGLMLWVPVIRRK